MASLIASDLSYEVLQRRYLRGELHAGAFDSTNRKLHRVSGYREFIADVDDTGDRAIPVDERAVVPAETIPSWHVHGRKR